MVAQDQHDLYALFAFALRENDWALADLIATHLLSRVRVEQRLEAEVSALAKRAGSPRSLRELQHWATISEALAEDGD